jgi:hypothetical protein
MPALIRTYLSTKHSSSSAAAKLSGRVDGFALSQIKPSCMQPGRFNPRDPTLSNMSCLRSPCQEATTKLNRQCCYRDTSCWLGGTTLQVRPCSPWGAASPHAPKSRDCSCPGTYEKVWFGVMLISLETESCIPFWMQLFVGQLWSFVTK